MTLSAQRVTLITLGVADLARAKAFYTELGWVSAQALDTVVFDQMDGLALGLFGHEDLAADQGRAGAPLGTGAMTLAQNFPSTAEVDAAFACAEAAGAEILKRPQPVFWGGYSGYFADRDGHVWELAYNPFWPLDGRGALSLPKSP